MNKIVYGDRIFTSADIKSGSIYKARSLSSSVLEIDTMDVYVRSDDTTLTQFVKYAPISFFFDDCLVGTFYVSSVKRTSKDTYLISAVSRLGVMDGEDYEGGIAINGISAGNIIREVCGDNPVIVKTNLENVKLYGFLPMASRRNSLSQILLAMGAYVRTDYNGVLRVEPLPDYTAQSLTEDDVFLEGSLDYGTPAGSAIVTEHQYTKGSTRVTLFSGETSEGEIIPFSEPAHDLAASGFTILASKSTYAKVSAGKGTITGIKYIHHTKEISVGDPATIDTAVKIKDATLVSIANSYEVANRVLYYSQRAERVQSDVVYLNQEPGDVITAPNAYGDTVNSCIESVDINISARLRCTQKSLVNFVPPAPTFISDETLEYTYGTILTNSGKFTFPLGVVAAKAVLIQGGQTGYKSNAYYGEAGQSVTDAGQFGNPTIAYGGKGGRGGAPGAGGSGGKVNIVEFPVSSDAEYEYKAGSAGTPYSAANYGGHSTFWLYSSDGGQSYPNGYYDEGTKKTYALPGKAGWLYGADGGDGGNATLSSRTSGTKGKAITGANGIQYNGGNPVPSGVLTNRVGDHLYYGGFGGGGAGSQGDGQVGRAPSRHPYDYDYIYEDGQGGDGGDAAPNPLTDEELQCYGHGGNGSNGVGGGGGGAGIISDSGILADSHGGSTGSGSYTAGVQGCIILYYAYKRESAPVSRFLTKSGGTFTDSRQRLLLA